MLGLQHCCDTVGRDSTSQQSTRDRWYLHPQLCVSWQFGCVWKGGAPQMAILIGIVYEDIKIWDNADKSRDLQYHIFKQPHLFCHVWPVQDSMSAVFRVDLESCEPLWAHANCMPHSVNLLRISQNTANNTPSMRTFLDLLSYHHPPSVSRAKEWNWAHLPRVETCCMGETIKLVLCLLIFRTDFEYDRSRHIRTTFFNL